jgi:hypothetical protein
VQTQQRFRRAQQRDRDRDSHRSRAFFCCRPIDTMLS